jgi:hypothetical protein
MSMSGLLRTMSLVFAAGALGGLTNSLVVWLFGEYGIAQSLGVHIAPSLTPAWLYPRIVWGGIWGGLFLLPLLKRSVFLEGIILSLGPTLVQLFVIFPRSGAGTMGMQLGALTPALVLFYNIVWGVTAAVWLRMAKASR